MLFHSWLQNLRSALAPGRGHRRRPRRSATHRPRLEVLEDRTVPSGYQQINLVGYQAGLGHFTDPNLNGWGMTSLPDGSFCVANAFTTGLATFYDPSGHVLPQTITVPVSTAHPFGLVGHPTGVVYNPTSDFVITEGSKSAPARLIFDTLDGTICGWNPAVDRTHAIKMVDQSTATHPALYTGLEIAQNSKGQTVLYAADIGRNQVEMFNSSFKPIGHFTDSNAKSVDAGLGAWSVQAVNDQLYVTFANPFAPIKGPHGGVVDVFDTDGNLLKRFAANAPGAGPLQNPWGITQAPANFGAYSNDLLIGNVAGHGNINVYDPATGAYLGKLRQPDGAPIAITGLWDLEFGDGTPHGGSTNQLFFDAGPNAPGVSINGLFGVIGAAEDPSVNGGGNPVREAAAPRATASHAFSLTVARAVVVRPPATIPIVTVDDTFPTNVQFTALGGSGTGYTFKARGLPSGMTITSAGFLSGTPTQAGTFTVRVTATDSQKDTGGVRVQLTVDPMTVDPVFGGY